MRKAYPYLKAAVSAVALALAIINHQPAVLLTALLFCICGDLFLAWSGELNRSQKEPFFTIGIASFAVAHFFLILYFGLSFWKLIPVAVLIALLSFVVKTGLITPGKYSLRVGLYSIIVCLMFASSIGTPFFAAALLFWVSDGLLGIGYFRKGAPLWIGGVALVIYYASLFLLAL